MATGKFGDAINEKGDEFIAAIAERLEQAEAGLAERLEVASEHFRGGLSDRSDSMSTKVNSTVDVAKNETAAKVGDATNDKTPETAPSVSESISSETTVLASAAGGAVTNNIETTASDSRVEAAKSANLAETHPNHAVAVHPVMAAMNAHIETLPEDQRAEFRDKMQAYVSANAEKSAAVTPDNQVQQVAVLERQKLVEQDQDRGMSV